MFGNARSRTLTNGLYATCPNADSSLYCNIVNGFFRTDSIWPGKVDHGLVPAKGDWIPANWNSTIIALPAGPGPASL